MFRNSKVFLRTTYLLLIIVLGFTVSVQARPVQFGTEQDQPIPIFRDRGSGQTVSIRSTGAQRRAALEMWTPAARAAAEPLPWSAASPDQLQVASLEAAELSGPPGLAAGGAPNARADKRAQRQFSEEWEAVDEALLEELLEEMAVAEQPLAAADVYGTPAIFTSYQGNKWGQFWFKYPFRAIGKLYITGGGYCSASVISPNNIIVTAAHCVYDPGSGQWMPGWTFVPADRKGVAPYGTFPWVSATVLTNWQTTGQRRYDVAVITLGNNSAGRPVTYYTGWLGRSWNQSYVEHHHAVGYPSNLTGGGQWTHICAAESFYSSTDVVGMGCDMMWGSSGGPWIWDYEYWLAGAMNYVNSVVSGDPQISGTTFYGPRFSSNNIVPLCTAAGC